MPLKVHDFTNKELEKQLNTAAQATTFQLGNGPNYSLRVGRTSQQGKDVAQNVLTALQHALAYMSVHDEIKFEHISQASLRVGQSPELPFYNYLSKADLEAYFA